MADIGATLREARMRARIDITEVESATKIRARYLRAIENEEWDALPGPVYVKTFMRTYGDYLGLDSRLLVDEYKRRFERPSDGEQRSIASLHRERERAARGPLLPPWAIIAGVLVAVVGALYIVGTLSQSKSTTTPQRTSQKRATQHRPRRRPARRQTTTPAVTLPAAPQTVTLRLVPTGAVYICLVNGAGQRLISGQIFSAGQTIPGETGRKLLLTLGNNSVQMKVNGRDVSVPASSASVGFLITPGSTTRLPVSKQPTCA